MPAHLRARGVTLLELLFVTSIAAILAALAAPGAAERLRASALAAAANQLVGDLHFARSMAISRGEPVMLCLSPDGVRCLEDAGTYASKILILLVPGATSLLRDPTAEAVLRAADLPAGISVRGNRSSVSYWPVTRAGTTATFHVCHEASLQEGRQVIVSQTGRPRVADPQAGGSSCGR